MIGYHHLFIPGPSNVPEATRQAVNMAMENMLAPDFSEFTLPLFDDLKKIMKTQTGRIFIYPSAGNGMWEAAFSNLFHAEDQLLMANFGHFSNLWINIAKALQLNPIICDAQWGDTIPIDAYDAIIAKDKNHNIKAVCLVHSESATGVYSDIKAVREMLDSHNHPALLLVDAVSSVAIMELLMDDWSIDAVICASQKGLMTPPGLGILAVSPKALDIAKTSSLPKSYFDFKRMIAMNDDGIFPYTPPTPLLRGLRVSVDLLLNEGIENVWARHYRLAQGVREAIKTWHGCRLLAKSEKIASHAVSAIMVPEHINAVDVINRAHYHYHTSFGGGIHLLEGKAFRIGHLGWLNEVMVCSALASAEMALYDCGADITLGDGVGAAQRYFIHKA